MVTLLNYLLHHLIAKNRHGHLYTFTIFLPHELLGHAYSFQLYTWCRSHIELIVSVQLWSATLHRVEQASLYHSPSAGGTPILQAAKQYAHAVAGVSECQLPR